MSALQCEEIRKKCCFYVPFPTKLAGFSFQWVITSIKSWKSYILFEFMCLSVSEPHGLSKRHTTSRPSGETLNQSSQTIT